MQVTRRLILQKARHQATDRSRQHPLTACRHVVSGTISLPFRGAFHLSLTVLVHYRSPRVFSLGDWSPQLHTAFHVSRGTQGSGWSRSSFAYGTLTPCGRPFQAVRLPDRFVDSVRRPYNPDSVKSVWAFP